MKHTYHTKGTCAHQIEVEIIDGIVTHVQFFNGCDGSLAAVAKLVEGRPAEQAQKILSGITCGRKSTSCPDQLACAIAETLAVE
ncbi:MAG: TIGR03905 family TSCPD domain-containing protein [Oscillospiraceae bacterium]|nr:TIGR03905 family TSCPD domain-containing protein [Oscillospiraceae bacterium]